MNNPLSKENLAIGLIVISGGNIFYKFSNDKINLSKKINVSNANLLGYTLEKISNFIDTQLRQEVSLFPHETAVNLDYLNRLSIYNNGFIQFDKPSIAHLEFDSDSFLEFFEKYIALNRRDRSKASVDNSFEKVIQKVFQKPLRDLINVDYKVKKEQVPGLFFDYKLDGIGVNGSLYTVKSLDLNADRPIDNYRKEISELESLNYRLNLFSEKNDLNAGDNHHYLVIDPYKGSKPAYQNLYEIVKEQNNEGYPYSVINSSELISVTQDILNASSIMKFSDYLETVR